MTFSFLVSATMVNEIALVLQASIRRGATYEAERLGLVGRVEKGVEAVREVVGKVWPWVLAGIAAGAGIHGYVPEGLLASFRGARRVRRDRGPRAGGRPR